MRTRGPLLTLALFVAFAWFYQAGGWNQNSRFDLVRAIVEQGTLAIDAYEANTGDKARRDAHFYSDKAPGLALFVAPAAAIVKPAAGAVGSESYVVTLSYAATLWGSALPTALAGWILWWAARKLGASDGGALLAAVVFALGTPTWAYATLLFGHALATAALVAAWGCAIALGDRNPLRKDIALGAAVGLCAGWASITEFPCVPPAIAIAGFALAEAGGSRRLHVSAALAGGFAITTSVLAVYNAKAFGSALTIGYARVAGFGGMHEGLFGVTYPKAAALWGITLSPFRGLFFHAPVLFAALVGWPALLRDPVARRAGAVALAIALYFIVFNASYHYWDGGWSYGPRHMAGAIPFLCFPLAWSWTRAGRVTRVIVAAVAAHSFAITLVAVSTTAQPPSSIERPLAELQWPAFRDGDLSLNHQSFSEASADVAQLRGGALAHDAWNLGERMGLHGRASLVPLFVLWGVAIAIWRWKRCGIDVREDQSVP